MKHKRTNSIGDTAKVNTEVVFTMVKSKWESISESDKNEILGYLRAGIGDILSIIEKVEKIPIDA